MNVLKAKHAWCPKAGAPSKGSLSKSFDFWLFMLFPFGPFLLQNIYTFHNKFLGVNLNYLSPTQATTQGGGLVVLGLLPNSLMRDRFWNCISKSKELKIIFTVSAISVY